MVPNAANHASPRPARALLAAACAALVTGLVPGSPATPEAVARTVSLQKCQASDGSTLYTDRPCESFGLEGATLAVIDSGNDGLAPVSLSGTVDAATLAPGTVPTHGPTARRSPASGCARSPTQLAMDLQGAFALGDVNRIAESYHWVGLDHAAAMPVMARLERMSQSMVVDSRYYDASITSSGIGSWAAADVAPSALGGVLRLTLGGEGGHQVLDLQVEPYEGCYFVRF